MINKTRTNAFLKAFKLGSDPEKEELCEILYWSKQILGFVLGILFGLNMFQGIFAIGGYTFLQVGFTYFYVITFLKSENKMDLHEIYQEGFMILWILSYTFIIDQFTYLN